MSNTSRMPRPGAILHEVFKTVLDRKQTMPEKSYVATLLRGGTDAILCKLAEETGEVIKAAREQDKEKQIKEVFITEDAILGKHPPIRIFEQDKDIKTA